jgi:hypothetical protein
MGAPVRGKAGRRAAAGDMLRCTRPALPRFRLAAFRAVPAGYFLFAFTSRFVFFTARPVFSHNKRRRNSG